jgi:hypothetical protein
VTKRLPSLPEIASSIEQIGLELVTCSQDCSGVRRDQSAGCLPRCLVFERANRPGDRGSAIVGINPGRASREEEAFYRARAGAYESVVAWFATLGVKHPYYTRLRRLADQCGLSGPILWTELAKCENEPALKGLLPLSTLRECTGRFLNRELALLPPHWPVLAVGAEAFKALAYLYPKRTVIGVPHPTGAYGHFPRLFSEGTLLAHVQQQANEALRSQRPQVLWLQSSGAA